VYFSVFSGKSATAGSDATAAGAFSIQLGPRCMEQNAKGKEQYGNGTTVRRPTSLGQGGQSAASAVPGCAEAAEPQFF
jgi:hypothetical protein